jgi:hypothetical protein
LPTRRPEWALAAASGSAVLLVLGLAEGALRARGPDPAEGLLSLHRYSEVYGWAPRPGVYRMRSGKTVAVNAAGQRGPAVPLRGDGREPRVLLLGDSIAFGLEVGDEETFAHHLDVAHGFEVVNLAVDGYGPDQALLKLEREGLGYSPDAVVLNVCLENDFADAVSSTFLYDGAHPKPYFRLQGDDLVLHDAHLKLAMRHRLGLALRDRSRLFRAVASALDRRRPAPAHWLDRRDALLADPHAEALTLALVARMSALARGSGAELLVALHPGRGGFRRGSRWARGLASLALSGTRVVEMREAYLARGLEPGALVMDHVGHLTPAGHRAAAGILAAALAPS